MQELAAQVQAVTGATVEIAIMDQGYTGEQAAPEAAEQGIKLEVVKLPEAKKGFVLLPDAGWSSGVSPGQPGSAAWPATTSGCQRPWRACISSPLPS